jgi:hypothetical protein
LLLFGIATIVAVLSLNRQSRRVPRICWAVAVGRVCLWPNGLFTGNHVEFRVPVDDENTLSVMWHFSRVPREREPYVQNSIPTWQGPIADPATGRWITSHVMNQDFVTWVGQGRTARTGDDLGDRRDDRLPRPAPTRTTTKSVIRRCAIGSVTPDLRMRFIGNQNRRYLPYFGVSISPQSVQSCAKSSI